MHLQSIAGAFGDYFPTKANQNQKGITKMTNSINKTLKASFTFNSEVIKTDNSGMKTAIASIKAGLNTGSDLAAKLAPYAVALASSDYSSDKEGKRTDYGQLNSLYFALSGKTKKENVLQAQLRMFACFHVAGLTFKKGTTSPFEYTKSVKAEERFLSEDFKFSLDFRLYEKTPAEKSDKVTLVTAKRLEQVNEQLVKSFNSIDASDAEKLAEYKLDLFEAIVAIAGHFDPAILINRLEQNIKPVKKVATKPARKTAAKPVKTAETTAYAEAKKLANAQAAAPAPAAVVEPAQVAIAAH